MKDVKAALFNVFVLILLICGFVATVLFFPLTYVAGFVPASLIAYRYGRLRNVFDPIFDYWGLIYVSPRQFHRWATRVCSSEGFKAAEKKFFEQRELRLRGRIRLAVERARAGFYFRGRILLPLIALALLLFCVPQALLVMQQPRVWLGFNVLQIFLIANQPRVSWAIAVPLGVFVGLIWGYTLGMFVLYRKCIVSAAPVE
jgi:hypothetical protein